MKIAQFSPDDPAAIRDYADVVNAVSKNDTPWVHETTENRAAMHFRYGWDLEPDTPFLATVDGAPVAVGAYQVSEHDNRDVSWFDVQVHPAHRRRGYGSLMLERLAAEARAIGRTSFGISCWDVPGLEDFALHHGFERKAVGVNRRQYLRDVDLEIIAKLNAEALDVATDYEVIRTVGMSAESDLEDLARLTAAINDAPKEGLEIEDQVFTADRIRDYETAQRDAGDLLHRVVVRHRSSGELAGQTLVAVSGERPHLGEQHDTSVVDAHRGHRLGALLKSDMLLWLAETQPQLQTIDTWNAESNRFMIDVNEALGYRVVGRAFDLQKTSGRTQST